MSDGYTKIYGDRLRNSSLWLECWQARLVFIEMLAIADRHGYVTTPSVRVLANALNLSVADVEAGLAVLESPDADSRTDVEQGRRVLRKQGGFFIVNYAYYREFRTERQEQERRRMAEKRAGSPASDDPWSDANKFAENANKLQTTQHVAPPEDGDGSESEDFSSEGESAERGWTAERQVSAFRSAFERTQRTIPSMGGRFVGSFYRDVLRTAELQSADPAALFAKTLDGWLTAGLSEAARRAPYACFQQAWGDLTSKAAAAPPGGAQAGDSPKALRGRAAKAVADGDHALAGQLMAKAKEIESADERGRRGR
jgi:hypothetical protein